MAPVTSTSLRERGNALYKEAVAASAVSISDSVKLERLRTAISIYQQALRRSDTKSEKAKCCKNLGQAFWRKFGIIWSQKPKINKVIGSHLQKSASFFLDAINQRDAVEQPDSWVQDLHSRLEDIAEAVLAFPKKVGLSDSQLGSIFEMMSETFKFKVPKATKSQASALIQMGYAEYVYHKLDFTLHNGDCKGKMVSGFIKLCGSLLEIAEDHMLKSQQSLSLQDIKDLRGRLESKLPLLKAMEARQEGNFSLERAKQLGANSARTELLNSALKKFKESEILCRNNGDTYGQALSFCSIADAYNGLSMDREAGIHYESCISLAATILGGQSPDPKWLRHAINSLNRIVEKTENQRANENQGSALPPEVEALHKAHATMEPEQFLRYLYAEHPPMLKSGEFGTVSKAALKNAYEKARLLYHPDKNPGWRLAEEIIKYLNLNLKRMQ